MPQSSIISKLDLSPVSPNDRQLEPESLVDDVQISTTPTGRLIHPNWWWKYRSVMFFLTFIPLLKTYRQIIREVAAEFAGVMILVIFGAGVTSQVVLSSDASVALTPKGVGLLRSFFDDVFNCRDTCQLALDGQWVRSLAVYLLF